MNRVFSVLLLAGLFCVVTDVSAQYEDWPQEDLYTSDEERYGHLKYFGFFASAMYSWNFTEELAPFTNLTWIHVGFGNEPAAAIEQIVQRLGEAHNASVQATLSIEPFLFTDKKGKLRTDIEIEEFLMELRAQLEINELLDTVAMIYPIDEPFRELIDRRNPNFIEKYITGKVYDEIHQDLGHLNDLIKLYFPEKPTGVIFSGYKLNDKFFSIPENYDWVGFDCYRNLFRSCDKRSFVEHYSQLLNLMQPHQRLMAVPEAWAVNEAIDRADWPDVLASRMRHHYEIALNEPRFVAFIPFIWSFDTEGDAPGLGLNRFVELYDDGVDNRGTAFIDLVTDIGLQIKDGEQEPPNMAYEETENSEHRPESHIFGEILSVDRSGLVSAWAINTALPHKNLRIQVLVWSQWGKLIRSSRIERTFIRDNLLAEEMGMDSPAIGLHGYRYQIPRYHADSKKWQNVQVELLVYADGDALKVGAVDNLQLIARSRLPRPPRKPIPTIQSAFKDMN